MPPVTLYMRDLASVQLCEAKQIRRNGRAVGNCSDSRSGLFFAKPPFAREVVPRRIRNKKQSSACAYGAADTNPLEPSIDEASNRTSRSSS